MASVRKNILTKFESILKGIPSLRHVDVNRPTVPDWCNFPMPSCFIFSGEEIRSDGVIGEETWNMTIVVELWSTKATDPEDLLKLVHDTVYADSTLDLLVRSVVRSGTSELTIDPTNEISGLQIKFLVQYSHPWGVM